MFSKKSSVRFRNKRNVSRGVLAAPIHASGVPFDPLAAQHLADLASSASPEFKEAVTYANDLLYTIADAVAAVDVDAATSTSDAGWLAPIADRLEELLRYGSESLTARGIDNATGWSIFGLTLFVKILTYPLTKKQIESSMAQQNLAPMIKAIKARYPDDKDKANAETARVYEQAGVNPLAGCLPTLFTLPIFWGLYRALLDASSDTSGLFNQSFYFIPDLAGPTTQEKGTAWLLPLVDGQPPIGWDAAWPYVTLSAMIVIAQLISQELIKQPETGEETESQKTTLLLLKFLPFMIGWFSLNVPAGLGLYWFSNTVLTTATQVYLRYGGGANPVVTEKMMAPKIKLGTAIRSSTIASAALAAPAVADGPEDAAVASDPEASSNGVVAAPAPSPPPTPPPQMPAADFGDDLPAPDFGAPADFGAPSAMASVPETSAKDVSSLPVEMNVPDATPSQMTEPVAEPPAVPQGARLVPFAVADLTGAVAEVASVQRGMREMTMRRCKRQRRNNNGAKPVTTGDAVTS